jgi:hypothetical protein
MVERGTEHLFRSASHPNPEARQLEWLDENVKRALTAAAVIGRSFSLKLQTASCEIEVDELFTPRREGVTDGNNRRELRRTCEAVHLHS